MQNSLISWTHHTFNPWIGCSKVHTGCTNCYAENLMDTRYGRVQWGPNGTRSRTKTWGEPRKWNKKAEQLGERHRVFCASLADVFEDWRKPIEGFRSMDDARASLFDLIDETPWLDWLLLTKRPENIQEMWPNGFRFRENVWLGTSVSDQETAKAGLRLLRCRDLSPVLFLSCEPIVGPIDLHAVETPAGDEYSLISGYCGRGQSKSNVDDLGFPRPSIDWVIVGGESGAGARVCRYDWLESLWRQCSATVPFWMKQLGSNSDVPGATGKGEKKSEWPLTLMVQQLPRVPVPFERRE